MDASIATPQAQAKGVARQEDVGLFGDLDAIDKVGSFAEAICREIAILLIVENQSFSHGLG
jgi:hypothetical protein